MVSWISIGDWGQLGQLQLSVADAMARVAAEEPVDFVLAVGDNFYPRGVSSTDDALWKYVYRDVYRTKPALENVPWYVALGNHDYMKSAVAQVEYSRKDPLWRMPSNYYDYRVGDVHFIVLDTVVLLGKGGACRQSGALLRAKHLAWLEDTLEQSGAKWIVVGGHHPIFSVGVHGGTRGLRRKLIPLFNKYAVDMYIAGHNHNMEHITSGNRMFGGVMHHVLSGAASKSRPTLYCTPKLQYKTSRAGFTVHRLDPDKGVLETEYIIDGEVAYRFSATARPKHRSGTAQEHSVARRPAWFARWMGGCMVWWKK